MKTPLPPSQRCTLPTSIPHLKLSLKFCAGWVHDQLCQKCFRVPRNSFSSLRCLRSSSAPFAVKGLTCPESFRKLNRRGRKERPQRPQSEGQPTRPGSEYTGQRRL